MSREVMQQALEALDYCIEHSAEIVAERAKDRGQGSDDLQMMMVEYLEKHRGVITTLRAALAEQDDDLTAAWMAGAAEERKRAEQPQPAYWGVFEGGNLHDFFTVREMAEEMAYYKGSHAVVGPIYTTPPAPQSLRDLCAAAYQAVGVADGPVEMLDNLWAAAEGKPLPHDPGAGLPWSPPSPQPQQPLVWRYKPMVGAPWSLSDDGYYVSCKRDQGYIVEPLYAAPQPLSGLDVERLLEDVIGSLPVARKLVRAVEAEVLKRMGRSDD